MYCKYLYWVVNSSHLKFIFKFKILKNSDESEGVIEKQVLSYREKCMQPTTLNPLSESWVWIKQHRGKTKQHLPNTRTSVLTRQVTHAIISCWNHTVIHNTKFSFSFKQQIKTFLQHIYFFFKENKIKHCTADNKKGTSLSQLMAETSSGMRICTESKILQMCEQAQGQRKGDVWAINC